MISFGDLFILISSCCFGFELSVGEENRLPGSWDSFKNG